MSKVSIIVPIYNCSSFLNECIDSILSQSYKNFELLLINDGSTDNSQEIIESYAIKDSRIRFFPQENQGVSVARNKGIQEAKGDFLLFVDGDDWIDSNALTHLITKMEQGNYDCVSYKRDFAGK